MKMIWIYLLFYSLTRCDITSISYDDQRFYVKLDSNPENFYDEDIGYSIKSYLSEVLIVTSIEEFIKLKEIDVAKFKYLLYNNSTLGRLVLSYPIPIAQINEDIYSKLLSLANKTVIHLSYSNNDDSLYRVFSIASYVTLSLIGVLMLYVISCYFYYRKPYYYKLHCSNIVVIISRLMIILSLIVFCLVNEKNLQNQTEDKYKLAEILKFLIELSNRIYIVMFMMYLNVIARGWQLNKDTPFINELGKLKFFLIGLLMFSLSDLVITNDFFEFYIQPLKSLILFGILGVLVLNSITSTYVTININRIPDERLYPNYIRSVFTRKNILKYLHAFIKLYLFTLYILVGLINYWAQLHMSMGYFVIADSLFCFIIFILLRPRSLILLESFYTEFEETLFKFTATKDQLNRAPFGELIPYREKIYSGLPMIIINPFVRSTLDSLYIGYN